MEQEPIPQNYRRLCHRPKTMKGSLNDNEVIGEKGSQISKIGFQAKYIDGWDKSIQSRILQLRTVWT